MTRMRNSGIVVESTQFGDAADLSAFIECIEAIIVHRFTPSSEPASD